MEREINWWSTATQLVGGKDSISLGPSSRAPPPLWGFHKWETSFGQFMLACCLSSFRPRLSQGWASVFEGKYVLFFVGLFEERGLGAVAGLPFAPDAQAAGAAATGPHGQGPLLHGHQTAADVEGPIDQAVEGLGAWGGGPGAVLAG